MRILEKEKGLNTEYLFRGSVINLRVDTVLTPAGNTVTREVAEHPGGVGIVALTGDREIYMVRQYRRPFDDFIYEIPAGKLESGEDHRECGIRELEEEVAVCAANIRYLDYLYPTPGFCNEKIHIYLATGLTPGRQNLDEDEFVEVSKVHVDTLVKMIMAGEIKDAKTVAGIIKTKLLLDSGEIDGGI